MLIVSNDIIREEVKPKDALSLVSRRPPPLVAAASEARQVAPTSSSSDVDDTFDDTPPRERALREDPPAPQALPPQGAPSMAHAGGGGGGSERTQSSTVSRTVFQPLVRERVAGVDLARLSLATEKKTYPSICQTTSSFFATADGGGWRKCQAARSPACRSFGRKGAGWRLRFSS